MKCFNHADIDAVGICKNCNKGLCQDCLTEVDNGIACSGNCVDEVNQVNKLIDRNKQSYKMASAAHKRNAWLFGGIGLVFLIFGLQSDGVTGFLSIMGFLFLIGAVLSMATSTKYSREKKQPDESPLQQDTKPKVTGIGGIFFFSENPEKTKEWYSEHLGLEVNQWGSSFEFRNAHRPEEINYLQWSPFKQGSEYFAPSEKEFMINYRVQNIEGLLRKLKDNGVTILDNIETYEYGKFVHIMDAEGNKIELWEPIDRVFTDMGGTTTK